MSIPISSLDAEHLRPIKRDEVRVITLDIAQVHALIWDYDRPDKRSQDGHIITAFAAAQNKPGALSAEIVYDPSKPENVAKYYGQLYCLPVFRNFPEEAEPVLDLMRRFFDGQNFPSDIQTLWIKIMG